MKRRILLLSMSILIMLTVMVSSAPFLAVADDEDPAGTTTDAASQSSEAEAETTTDENAALLYNSLDEFEFICKNGNLEMYLLELKKQLICVAVKNTDTGNVWYSAPADSSKITNAPKRREVNSHAIISLQDEKTVVKSVATGVSVMNNDYKIEKLSNGVKITYDFPDIKKGYGFTVPMLFEISDDTLNVSVDFENIVIADECTSEVLSIAVLPYFGCGEYGQDGYMFVPDGSGALIDNDFESLDGDIKRFSTYIYGRDPGLDIPSTLSCSETATLPVFGTVANNQAVMGVITSGDTLAQVKAVPSRKNMPFTACYAEFTYMNTDIFKTNDRWNQKDYQQAAYSHSLVDKCTVKYYFLSGDDANYVGMAHTYQDYLIANGVNHDVSDNLSFYMDIIGAIKKSESRFGMVMDITKPITTFENAEEMLGSLTDSGVKNIIMRYTGWQKGGLESTVVTDTKVESVLGGKKGLQSLNEAAESSGTKLFLDSEFIKIYNSKFGWSYNKFATHNILNNFAVQYFYKLNTGMKTDYSYYLINRKYLQTEADAVISGLSELGISNVSLGSLGSTVYSDFQNGENFSDRQQTADSIVEVLKRMDETQSSVMVDQGNSYSLANADYVIAPPMYDSGYEMSMTDVPFLQIALHGIVNYTETAHNLSSDTSVQLLRQLETGSAPYYIFTYEENSVFLDTNFSSVYSSNFYTWKDTAVEDYKRLDSVMNGHCSDKITDHRIITDDVRATTYGDSMTVVVNYGRSDYDYNGQVVPAGGYIVYNPKEVA
jgi:hypothetical protein